MDVKEIGQPKKKKSRESSESLLMVHLRTEKKEIVWMSPKKMINFYQWLQKVSSKKKNPQYKS